MLLADVVGEPQRYLEAVLTDWAERGSEEASWDRLCGAADDAAEGKRRGTVWAGVLRDEQTLRSLRVLGGYDETATLGTAKPVVKALVGLGGHYKWAVELGHWSEVSDFFRVFCTDANPPVCEARMLEPWLALFRVDPMAPALLVRWGQHVLGTIDRLGGGGPMGEDEAGGGSGCGAGAGRMGAGTQTKEEKVLRENLRAWLMRVERSKEDRGPDGGIHSTEWACRAKASRAARELMLYKLGQSSADGRYLADFVRRGELKEQQLPTGDRRSADDGGEPSRDASGDAPDDGWDDSDASSDEGSGSLQPSSGRSADEDSEEDDGYLDPGDVVSMWSGFAWSEQAIANKVPGWKVREESAAQDRAMGLPPATLDRVREVAWEVMPQAAEGGHVGKVLGSGNSPAAELELGSPRPGARTSVPMEGGDEKKAVSAEAVGSR